MHTSHPLLNLLFPAQRRHLARRRLWQGLLRALHIVCFSLLTGGLFVGQSVDGLYPWLLGTVISGLLLLALDMYSSCFVLFEVRGISVLIKIPLVAVLPAVDEQFALGLLILLIVLSTLVSHATRGLRHRCLAPMAWRQRLDCHLSDEASRPGA